MAGLSEAGQSNDLARLLEEGESLSPFEANHLANFPVQEFNRAAR